MSAWAERVVSLRRVAIAGVVTLVVGVAAPVALVWGRTAAWTPTAGGTGTGTVGRSLGGTYRPDLVIIPAPGSFMVGSPADEAGRPSADEVSKSSWLDEPRRQAVIAQDYALSVTEVTQAQWAAVMGTRPSYFAASRGGRDDHPVERVSAYDVLAYLNRLSQLEGLESCYRFPEGCRGAPGSGCAQDEAVCTGDYVCPRVVVEPACRGYRLPTEGEWEHAARAGTETAIFTGALEIRGENNGPALDPIAWYGGNSGLEGGFDCSGWRERQDASRATCGTHPVATKRPNGWRLHDVLGNVLEWTVQEDGSAPPELGEPRMVMRGCSWFSSARSCRAAYRHAVEPADRGDFVGFRLARSFPRPSSP